MFLSVKHFAFCLWEWKSSCLFGFTFYKSSTNSSAQAGLHLHIFTPPFLCGREKPEIIGLPENAGPLVDCTAWRSQITASAAARQWAVDLFARTPGWANTTGSEQNGKKGKFISTLKYKPSNPDSWLLRSEKQHVCGCKLKHILMVL